MRVIFMGTPQFAVPSLERLVQAGHQVALVVTQPDRPKGRGQKMVMPPVKERAMMLNLSVAQLESVNTETFAEVLQSMSPECIVVVAFGQILKRSVLEIPANGCVNVHASLLPRYRGAAPIQWAIMNGEAVTGVTTMYMNEQMDAGDVILQREVPIAPEDTCGALEAKLAAAGADLLVETLAAIAHGTASRVPQDHSKATYAPMLQKEDGRMMWTRSAHELHNQVRGMNPHPGAFTGYEGRVLKVWETAVIESHDTELAPGCVAHLDSGFPVVQTGKGCLRLVEVQPQDRKRLRADAWVRGTRMHPPVQLS